MDRHEREVASANRIDVPTESRALQRAQDEERRQPVEVNSFPDVFREEHAGQQGQAVDLPVVAGNSPFIVAGDNLQRLTAFHAPEMRRMAPSEAPVRVHAPRDLVVQEERPCRLNFLVATPVANAAEESHNHTEWEIFTTTLLAVHRCIHKLTLRILAVPETPERFYQGFSMGGGTALIDIVVSARELPSLAAVENYLRYLMRLRCPENAAVQELRIVAENYDCSTTGNGHPGLNERLVRIMEATMDMPFLALLAVHLRLPGPGPHVTRKHGAILMHDDDVIRKQRYKASKCLAQWLNCGRDNTFYASTTIGASTQRHKLLARRELTGSQANLAPYLVSLRHSASPYDLIVSLCSVEGMEEQSTEEAARPQ